MSQLSARTWVAGTVVVALLLLAASWFLLLGPVRAEAAGLRDETVTAEEQNAALQAETVELRRQFADLPTEQRTLAALREALPSDVALPTLLRDITRYADQSGLTLMSVAPGTPAPIVDPAAAAPAETAGPTTTAIPLTTTVIGEFFDAQGFLELLQTEMPRAYLVRSLSVTAEDAGDASGGRPTTMVGDVTLTITADVFARPSTLDPSPSALPTVPAPGGGGAPLAPEGPGLTETPAQPSDGQPAPSGPAPAGASEPSSALT